MNLYLLTLNMLEQLDFKQLMDTRSNKPHFNSCINLKVRNVISVISNK